MKLYRWNEIDERTRRSILERPAVREDVSVQSRVAEIIESVKRDGDMAVLQYENLYGHGTSRGFVVAREEFAEAKLRLTAKQRRAIEVAASNIRKFHAEQLPSDVDLETAPGVRCQRVSRPLQSVGLYVPAGVAPLPSTALMLGVPAAIAGCPTRIICSPPQADGRIDAGVLYAAEVAEIDRIYKIGGAQAIAAMAYGTESIPRVHKIFGPGNAWVTAAKAYVSQDPLGAARDMPAGPSEVMVIADAQANPAFVAADLLSQAEHGDDSQVVLITDTEALATLVMESVREQSLSLGRRETIEKSLRHSSAVLVSGIDEAIDLADRYAPEHLIMQVENPRRWLPKIRAAGSVFLGPWTPESIGDYCSGTNHVLPTYGFARSYSSLGVSDFMRSMTVQELTEDGLRLIGPVAETIASMEGLDAHARAVSLRIGRRSPGEAR